MPYPVENFDAARLRSLRAAAGLSVVQVAAAAGVVHGAVRAWEAGTSAPTPPKLVRLAAALGVDVDHLLVEDHPVTLSTQRSRRGLLQSDVADALGVPTHRYSKVERGEAGCPPGWLPTLATLFDVAPADVAQLIDLPGPPVVDLVKCDDEHERAPESC